MKKEPFHGHQYLVTEALHEAELVYMCQDGADIKRAIQEMVNNYDCDVEDIVVLPLSAHIPFTFKKVETVEISL